jgi:hypothetical protein
MQASTNGLRGALDPRWEVLRRPFLTSPRQPPHRDAGRRMSSIATG